MRRIAYIPARGGSKGIPKKNIKALCGKPLIAYTIEAALETGLFDVVFVSTDSAEIAGVAKQYGAQVPFLRYAEVAQDTTKTIDTVCSDVARMRNLGWEFDTFVLLQATSPLRRAKDIAGAVARFEGGNGGGGSQPFSGFRAPSLDAVDERDRGAYACAQLFQHGEEAGLASVLPRQWRDLRQCVGRAESGAELERQSYRVRYSRGGCRGHRYDRRFYACRRTSKNQDVTQAGYTQLSRVAYTRKGDR